MDHCRVSKHYPCNSTGKDSIMYIAYLDGKNPVPVKWQIGNGERTRSCGRYVNLYQIVYWYRRYVPKREDWYVAYESGLDFDEDIRHRNMRKYPKGLVYNMLMRLIHHNVLKGFWRNDLIRKSWDGEVNSYFRPNYTICVKRYSMGIDLWEPFHHMRKGDELK